MRVARIVRAVAQEDLLALADPSDGAALGAVGDGAAGGVEGGDVVGVVGERRLGWERELR